MHGQKNIKSRTVLNQERPYWTLVIMNNLFFQQRTLLLIRPHKLHTVQVITQT